MNKKEYYFIRDRNRIEGNNKTYYDSLESAKKDYDNLMNDEMWDWNVELVKVTEEVVE